MCGRKRCSSKVNFPCYFSVYAQILITSPLPNSSKLFLDGKSLSARFILEASSRLSSPSVQPSGCLQPPGESPSALKCTVEKLLLRTEKAFALNG